jgi:cytochrome c5
MGENEHDSGHESTIDTPKQVVTVIAIAFLVPFVIAVLVLQFIANMRSVDKESPAMSPDAVAKRLKPVGDLTFADAGGDAAKAPKSGEEIYKSVCTACHASGVAGAPKFGDKSGWASRLKEGQKPLVETAIKGEGAMPPRGGSAGLSDLEVERAVVYMANSAGGKFKEPAAPAAEKTAAPAPAAGKTATPAPAQEKAAVPAAQKTAAAAPTTEKTTAPAAEKMAAAPAAEKAAPAPAAEKAAASAAGKADGKKVYETTCTVCHGAGIAGAPKAGDKAAWAPRLKTGMDALYASALKGKGAMPAKGGNNALADADVKAAVDYLASLAK